MGTYTDFALAWIRDAREYLLTCNGPILAESEDCVFFRQQKSKKATPPPSAAAPALPPPMIPAPSAVAPALPPPMIPVVPLAAAPLPPKIEAPPPLPPIVQEKLKKQAAEFSNHLRTLIAPEVAVLSEIPSDAIAKKIATRWKTKNQTASITVICYQESDEQKELLGQIAKALEVHFGPAKLISADTIEREKQWEAFLSVADLQLIISCDFTLWQLPNLMRFYREIPNQKSRQLGDKPLFMLPDLSLYLKDPLLKRSLWKALCQTISSLPSLSTKK